MPVEVYPIRPPVHPISEIPGHVFILDSDPFPLLQQNPFFKTTPHGEDYLLEVTPYGQILIGDPIDALNVGDAVNFFVDDTDRVLVVDTPEEQAQCAGLIWRHPDNQRLIDANGNLTQAAVTIDITVPGNSVCTNGIEGKVNQPLQAQILEQEVRRQTVHRTESKSVLPWGLLGLGIGIGISLPLLIRMLGKFNQGYDPNEIYGQADLSKGLDIVKTYDSLSDRMTHIALLQDEYGKDNVIVHRDGSVYIKGIRETVRNGQTIKQDFEELRGQMKPLTPFEYKKAKPYFPSRQHSDKYVDQLLRDNPGAKVYYDEDRIMMRLKNERIPREMAATGNFKSRYIR